MLVVLVDLPRGWLVTVAFAAVVSLADVTVPHDGAWTVALRVSATTLWVLSLAWLPSILRILTVIMKSIKFGGLEIAGDGLSAILARTPPAPPGTVNASVQQQVAASSPASGPTPPGRPTADAATGDRPAWASRRGAIYEADHDLFLVHTLRPSSRADQKYEVAIYLVGAHGSDPTDVVESAEFYLGKYWGHRIIRATNTGPTTRIGMTTACYGPFLCLCRVVLKGTGEEIFLSRYVDWEMTWVFDAAREVTVAAA